MNLLFALPILFHLTILKIEELQILGETILDVYGTSFQRKRLKSGIIPKSGKFLLRFTLFLIFTATFSLIYIANIAIIVNIDI